MVDSVALNDIFIATLSGAMVVLSGALYALLYALARASKRAWLLPFAYLFYGVLTVFVYLLAIALHLQGIWLVLTIVMLAGYLLAPRMIWHLCRATHPDHASEEVLGSVRQSGD